MELIVVEEVQYKKIVVLAMEQELMEQNQKHVHCVMEQVHMEQSKFHVIHVVDRQQVVEHVQTVKALGLH